MSFQLGPERQGGIVPEWTVGDRLKKARETTGLDQVPFANLLEVARSTIINYEQGHVKPRRAVLKAWSEATGVSRDWIERGETDPRIVEVHPPGLEPGTH